MWVVCICMCDIYTCVCAVCVCMCVVWTRVYAFKINMFIKKAGQPYFPLKNLPLGVKLQKVLTCFGKSKFSFF